MIRERFHGMSELTAARLYQTNSGRLVSLKTGTDNASAVGNQIQSWNYDYDVHSNLKARETNAANVQYREEFSYDSLDRLQDTRLTVLNGVAQPGSPAVTAKYSTLGNLRERGQLTMAYGAPGNALGGPHAAISHSLNGVLQASYQYDPNGNQTRKFVNGSAIREIDYYGYDLVREIRQTSPVGATIKFEYSNDRALSGSLKNRSERVEG